MTSFSRVFLLCAIVLITQLGNAQSAQFSQHPEVNGDVELFGQSLISGLFPEFAQVELLFDRNEQGQIMSDLSRGQLNGTFSGVITNSQETSELSFDLSLLIDIEPEEKKEYRLNMKANGQASNTPLFMNTFVDSTLEKCSASPQSSPACAMAEHLSQASDVYEALPQALAVWKETILSQVAEVKDQKHGQFALIKDDFLAYLDERIQIIETEGSVTLTMSLGDLADKFRGQAGMWLNDLELIDYSIENVTIQWTKVETKIDLFFRKYHVISPFDSYMSIAKQFQDTLEDPEAGRAIGQSLRSNPGEMKESFKNNAHLSDKISAGGALLNQRLLGRPSQNQDPTKEEMDLGLE